MWGSRFRKPVAPPPPEDALKQLVNYDVIVLMDDSPSMRGSRWQLAKKVMEQVVEKAAQYDEDGIEIQFLNNTKKGNVKSEEEVRWLFRDVHPQKSTPLGRRLGEVCKQYIEKLERNTPGLKRCLIVAITDGMPDQGDTPLVYSAIRETLKILDELDAPLTQLGIQFVQIGDNRGATVFLKELDDNLKNKDGDKVQRDIVDTVPYHGADLTSEELVKILAGAINKKVDKQTGTGRLDD